MIKIQDDQDKNWYGESDSVRFGAIPSVTPLLNDGLGLRYLKQVHGNQVIDDAHFKQCGQVADGLVSEEKKLALVIRTADCIPLHIWDHHRIAMIHAGWRSIRAGIISRSVQDFKTCETKTIIGPSIFSNHYEVDSDLYEPWLEDWPELERFLSPSSPGTTKRNLDLRNLAVYQLVQAGVASAHIHRIDRCTYASNLPSYRREGPGARRIYNYIYRCESQ